MIYFESQIKQLQRPTAMGERDEPFTPLSTSPIPTNQDNAKRNVLYNLFTVSIVFMLEGTTFSLRLLESSVHRRKGAGTLAVGSIFLGTFVSCLVSPLIIHFLGLKRTFTFGWMTFCIFTLANFFPSIYILVPTGLLAGFMLGPVLASQGTYVTTLAAEYAAAINTRQWMATISIFNGIFFTLFQVSL